MGEHLRKDGVSTSVFSWQFEKLIIFVLKINLRFFLKIEWEKMVILFKSFFFWLDLSLKASGKTIQCDNSMENVGQVDFRFTIFESFEHASKRYGVLRVEKKVEPPSPHHKPLSPLFEGAKCTKHFLRIFQLFVTTQHFNTHNVHLLTYL